MQAVADAAGVHVQTIYLAYGTKPALLAACAARLVAGDEDPETHPSERRWALEVAAAEDPRAKLARYVQQIGDVTPRIAPLIDVLRTTAPAEPVVAAFLAEMERGRREGSLQLIARGVSSGTWRPVLTEDDVADIVFAIVSPDTFRALTERCGWPREHAEALLVRTLEHELLTGREERAAPRARTHLRR
jgi:AcrR family transcriptional regulator